MRAHTPRYRVQLELERVQREAADKDTAMAAIGSNITSAWDACQKLLRDMAAVSGHLAKMGWEVKVSGCAERWRGQHVGCPCTLQKWMGCEVRVSGCT
eukprot:355384-Chlamydomonas_euryale.AAC.3